MPGIVLNIQHLDRSQTRGLSRRFSALVKETMFATAEHWHAQLFPKHFGPRNRSEYQLTPRNPFYLAVIKPKTGEGVGRFRDLVLSGKSQRFLQVLYRVTGSSKRVTVRMTPPPFFTNPFVGSFAVTDKRTGRTHVKHISRQPDKADEVTRISEEDKRDLRAFAAADLAARIKQSSPPPTAIEFK